MLLKKNGFAAQRGIRFATNTDTLSLFIKEMASAIELTPSQDELVEHSKKDWSIVVTNPRLARKETDDY
jgi:hypothetical protein